MPASFGGSRNSGPKKPRRGQSYTPIKNRNLNTQTRLGGGGNPRTGQGNTPRPGVAPTQKPKPQAKPQGSAPTPDAKYNEDIAGIQSHRDTNLSQIGENRVNTEHEFGINDPTNPFSRMEGMKKSYLARKKGVSANLASQGQLYSGAHERALSRTRLEEEEAYNNLRNAYREAMSGYNKEEGEVKYGSAQEEDDAFKAWLDRAPEAEEGPADTEPVGDGTGGAPAPKPKPQTSGGSSGDPEGHRVSSTVVDPFANKSGGGKPKTKATIKKVKQKEPKEKLKKPAKKPKPKKK